MSEEPEFDISNIKVIRLVNGQLIIGYLASADGKTGMVTIERPYTVSFNVDLSNNEEFVYLADFMILTDNLVVNIHMTQVLAVSAPNQEGIDRWMEMVKHSIEAEKAEEEHVQEGEVLARRSEISLVSSNDTPEESDKPEAKLYIVRPDSDTVH